MQRDNPTSTSPQNLNSQSTPLKLDHENSSIRSSLPTKRAQLSHKQQQVEAEDEQNTPTKVKSNPQQVDIGKIQSHITLTKQPKVQASTKRKAFNLYTIGRQHQTEGQHQQALQYYEQCLSLDPTMQCVYEALSTTCIDMGDAQGGKSALQNYIKNAPESPKAYYLMADFQHKCCDRAEAIQSMKKFMELSPPQDISAKDYITMAQLHCRTRHSADAEEYYTKAYQKAPNDPKILKQLFDYYINQSKYKKSIQFLEQIIKLKPGKSGATERLILMKIHFRQLCQFTEVIDLGNKYLKEFPKIFAKQELSQIYRFMSRSYSRIDKYEQALDWHVTNSEKTGERSGIDSGFFGHLSEEESVQILTRKFDKGNFQSPLTYFDFGLLFYHYKNHSYALQAFEQAERLSRGKKRYAQFVRFELDDIFGRSYGGHKQNYGYACLINDLRYQANTKKYEGLFREMLGATTILQQSSVTAC